MSNVVLQLAYHAQERPHAPAIIDAPGGRGDRVTTFAQLQTQVHQVAATLTQAGIQPGDGILVFHPMQAELYAVLLGILHCGAVALFADPGAGADHLRQCCALYPVKAFVGSPKAHGLRMTVPALRAIALAFVPRRSRFLWARPLLQAASPQGVPPVASCMADTPALMTFTSGSTGQPKAALRTHGFLQAQYAALQASLPIQPGEVELATLPVFTLANLATGATSLIPAGSLRRPEAVNPRPIWRQIQRHQPSRVIASPAFLQRLADHAEVTGQDWACFRTLYTGGAPVFPPLLRRLQRLAPTAQVVAVYGSTEAEPIAHVACHAIPDADFLAMQQGQGLLVGPVEPCTQLRILPDHWGSPWPEMTPNQLEQQTLAPGAIGEIVVSGAHVLTGYWQGMGDAETKIRVGHQVWHRTGDAGYCDQQGRLWLMGRCSAKLVDAVGVVYPFAVECAASSMPGLKRSAFVLHHGQRLLVVEAFPNQSIDQATLQQQLAWAHLANVLKVRRIPVDKRHNAKVDYPRLHALLQKK